MSYSSAQKTNKDSDLHIRGFPRVLEANFCIDMLIYDILLVYRTFPAELRLSHEIVLSLQTT